jgi:hypothetical protein
MNMTKLAFGFAFAMSVAPAANAATELVTNGGFEAGNLSGWSLTGNTGYTGVDGGAFSGSFAAYFGPIGSDGILSQVLSTVATGFYNISFYLANDNGTPNDFSVTFGGNTLFSQVNAAGSAYTLFTFNHVAASTNFDALVFNFRHDPAYYHLDDVSVTSAVPVPAAMPLLLAGLGGIGFVGRKSKKKKAA